ncbi:glycosyltransferase family A protein [Ectothiorhodospira shaposhnikovii]|uniref:glycosyltransferase family A protein n=1 Tax=Ectothiorhodospira shaposhnikovii TaxID=1054 RepID=UPI00399FF292
MTDTSITAIVTTYNRANIVSDAILSIFSQSHPVDELIVIDDGSSDNTQHVIKEVFKDAPIRTKYIYKKNGGMASALNQGITEAKSNWVAFLDDDDTWNPDHIEKCFSFISRHPQLGAVMGLRHEGGNLQSPPEKLLGDFSPIDQLSRFLIRKRAPLVRPFFTTALGTIVVRSDHARSLMFSGHVGARLDIHFIWLLGELTDIGLNLQSHGTGRQFRVSYLSTDQNAPDHIKIEIAIRRASDGIRMLEEILSKKTHSMTHEFTEAYEREIISLIWSLRKAKKTREAIASIIKYRENLPLKTQIRQFILSAIRQ